MGLVKIPAAPTICKNLVGGQFEPSTGLLQPVHSPYTGELIAHVPNSTALEVATAIKKAKTAFPAWRGTPIKERSQFLFRLRELMLAHIDELANTAAAESGKTFTEAKAGFLKGLEVAEFALSLQNLDSGALMEVSRGVTCHATREPLGVVVGITPFNFPAMVPLWMYPIALTLGNCFVLKPSEKVPLTTQGVAELIGQAGYPAGVFSVVNGGQATVEALIDHPDVKAVAFVGSTPVAKAIYQRATNLGKRALALGGAKNYLLVVPDAEPEMTSRSVLDSFTGCAGQRCMAASLMVAIGDVEQIILKIVQNASRIQLGSNMGAIIDKTALTRIEKIIDRAVQDGARLLLDGRGAKPPTPASYAGGYWLGPTIIDGATPAMECANVEIFGPVLTIIHTRSISEALQLEAQNPFGNATSIFTSSGAVAHTIAEQATSGMIGINIGVPVPREPFSFGGSKESKFGHGDITGESSLDFWSQLKKVTTKWAPQVDANWMS